jgi:predicted dehydrogenase
MYLLKKPVCKNQKEFLQIKKLLDKKKFLEISSNFVLRGHSSVQKLKRLVDQKKLGKIYYLEADYNYGRIKKITHGWRSRELNYSVFLGGGIHMFDLIMYFLKNRKIVSYQKINNKIATTSKSYKYSDFDLLTLKFDNNCIAKISSNFACVFPHSHFFKIYGTRGTFFFDHEYEIYAKNINGSVVVKKSKITNVNTNKKLVLLSFLDFLCNKKKTPLISKKCLLKITNDSLQVNEGKKIK